jgi:hypothetical protein
MDDDSKPLDTRERVIAKIDELTTLLSEMEENDRIPDDDRARMQADLRKQLDDLTARAEAQGYLRPRATDS